MSQPTLLTTLEQDALKECMNIGASHAATALSELTQEKVAIRVPDLSLLPVENVSSTIAASDEVMSAVVMRMGGDISGTILLMFPVKSALDLSTVLLRNPQRPSRLGDDENSAIREIGNILSGHSLNALSEFLGFRLIQSVPESSSDMVGAMMNEILSHFLRGKHRNILVLSVQFEVSGRAISGRLIFLIDPESTKVMLESLRKKLASDLG